MKSYPIIKKPMKLHRLGGGYAIFIPKDWFEAHGIDPEEVDSLLISANRHVVIHNPRDVKQEYRKHSAEIKEKMREVEK